MRDVNCICSLVVASLHSFYEMHIYILNWRYSFNCSASFAALHTEHRVSWNMKH